MEEKNTKHTFIVVIGIILILIISVVLYSRYIATKGLKVI